MAGGEHEAPHVSGLNQPGDPPRSRTRVRDAGAAPRPAQNDARKHAGAPPQPGAPASAKDHDRAPAALDAYTRPSKSRSIMSGSRIASGVRASTRSSRGPSVA